MYQLILSILVNRFRNVVLLSNGKLYQHQARGDWGRQDDGCITRRKTPTFVIPPLGSKEERVKREEVRLADCQDGAFPHQICCIFSQILKEIVYFANLFLQFSRNSQMGYMIHERGKILYEL